ncbi:IPExxxVDY family protein [Chryseobacterium taklimakanense]|uniref:IPExxxVDY family protein n=1 Tax=Chryseobacterium taklimakanense TaxID=536441 RepID=UPI001EF676C1|nr:IPExxxVDY family protein [Chryseobacterium taklimakanense]MCG7281033.1 IPExxxVDY family protein [Chryseobacterium taklimakanense]
MKSLKLFLDTADEDDLTLGLIRLAKEIPDYELFYHINRINDSEFKRIADIVKIGTYYDYYHPRFEAYHKETKACIQFIANKSVQSKQKQEVTELFADEENVNYLLPNDKDVDYLLKSSDSFVDFSVILLPESLMFQMQEYELSSQDELFQLIQYYE